MKLYHLTAIPPTGVTMMVHGSFTAPRQQELITACGSSIELYVLRPKEGRLDPLMRADVFAQIRALDAFRLPGTRRDYLVVTSDSGSLTILSADAKTAIFTQIHCEPFGKSGCRRIVPGQYLTCEPRGRACMVGAVEKQKFAYVLNRDAEENLTISSPLEAHKSNVATFALTSLDVGFENPIFAALERSYEKDSHKLLVYYELDLGLNHVVRKHHAPVRPTSSLILAVPGHTDGPGGVLVCSSGFVTYRSLLDEDSSGRLRSAAEAVNGENNQELGNASVQDGSGQIEARIPYREGTESQTTMIVSGTMYHDKKRNAFFFMLCTEYGDLLKAEITWDAEQGVTELRLVYFDTLPSPARDMCIFRSGFLAVAMEGSDTLLLKFKEVNVSDNDVAGGLSISKPLKSLSTDAEDVMDIDKVPNGIPGQATGYPGLNFSSGQDDKKSKLRFNVRKKLAYLSVACVLDSLSPLLSISAGQLSGPTYGALVCATGRSICGSIRAMRRGIGVMDLSSPHQLPSRLRNVFTLKDRMDNKVHRFIVVSFEDRTKVLEVGETRVEEILTSGFELGETTLCAGQMSTDSLMQVHRHGVLFIPHGKASEATAWKPPAPTKITSASCNREQVVVILSSGALVYFEINADSGKLQEVCKVPDVLAPSGAEKAGAPSLSIPALQTGRKRANFVAAADGSNKVRMFRIAQDGTVDTLGIHLAPAPVESLALIDFGFVDKEAAHAATGTRKQGTSDDTVYLPNLTLLIGTTQGAFVRLSVDHTSGAMSGSKVKFLGPAPVQVEGLCIAGVPVCFCMGSEPWILFPQGGRLELSPLGAEAMQHAAAFSSEQSPDGFVTTSGAQLRLLSIDLIHALVNSALLPRELSSVNIPSSTLLGCSYTISRTRTEGTPRRLFPLAQDAFASARVFRKEPLQSVGESSDPLFVVIESDQRMKYALKGKDNSTEMNSRDHGSNMRNANAAKAIPAILGSWLSRLQLVKLLSYGAEPENDNDENADDELDGSDPFVDLTPRAVEVVDEIRMPSCADCIITATSTAVLGPQDADPDALSYVIVSKATNLVISATSRNTSGDSRSEQPKEKPTFSLLVYKVKRNSLKLDLSHETKVGDPVHSLVPFRDMLLVGVGSALRLYDLGKRQLLRKAEYKTAVRNKICALAVAGGDRVFVGDVQESVTMFKYVRPGTMTSTIDNSLSSRREGGSFVPIASDEIPRWIVSLEALDYSTVCGSDKFGNIFILRLPSELAGATDEFVGVTSSEMNSLRPGSRTAPHKLSVEACIHVGSTVISVVQGPLRHTSQSMQIGLPAQDGADSPLVYCTLDGAIGLLAPLRAQSEAEFVQKLEREMRRRYKSLCGRDHIAYRSSFYPIKNVIDGDLCELFSSLSYDDQKSCAEATARPVEDVVRSLDELRTDFL